MLCFVETKIEIDRSWRWRKSTEFCRPKPNQHDIQFSNQRAFFALGTSHLAKRQQQQLNVDEQQQPKWKLGAPLTVGASVGSSTSDDAAADAAATTTTTAAYTACVAPSNAAAPASKAFSAQQYGWVSRFSRGNFASDYKKLKSFQNFAGVQKYHQILLSNKNNFSKIDKKNFAFLKQFSNSYKIYSLFNTK